MATLAAMQEESFTGRRPSSFASVAAAFPQRQAPPKTANCVYKRELLLNLRGSTHRGITETLPRVTERPERSVTEVEKDLATAARRGALPPQDWNRCSNKLRREAVIWALRKGHMHVVYAMMPESSQFQTKLGCQDLISDQDLMDEAMSLIISDTRRKGLDRPPDMAATLWLLEKGVRASMWLAEKKTTVRIRALSFIASLGPSSIEALDEVVACLGDQDSRIRRAAAMAMGTWAPHLEHEQFPNKAVCGKIIQACHRLAALIREDSEPIVQEVAAEALGQFGEDVISVWVPLLSDSNHEVRGLAALSFRAAGCSESPRVVAALARHADKLLAWLGAGEAMPVHAGQLRKVAVEALGTLNSAPPSVRTAIIDTFVACLRSDTDEFVRESAARVLGKFAPFCSEQVQTALADGLDDADEYVKLACALTIQAIAVVHD